MINHRYSPPLLALLLLCFCACRDEAGDTRQSSSSTNWLRCERPADCSAFRDATCAADGYCEDATGERIAADAMPDGDDDASPSVTVPTADDVGPNQSEGDDVSDDALDDDVATDDAADDATDDDVATDDVADDDVTETDDTVADDMLTDDDATPSADDDTVIDDAPSDDDQSAPSDDDTTLPTDDDTTSTEETSLGTVTLGLVVEPGRYCNQAPYCDGVRHHITVLSLDDGAVLLDLNGPNCGFTPCATCLTYACVVGCLSTPRDVVDEQVEWRGTYDEPSTCGDGVACETLRYAPPGRYLARMCATPGNIVPAADETGYPDPNGEFTTCERSGPDECVELEFEYPSSEPIVGSLPPGAGSAPADAGPAQ